VSGRGGADRQHRDQSGQVHYQVIQRLIIGSIGTVTWCILESTYSLLTFPALI
jgi:hypothetical protein